MMAINTAYFDDNYNDFSIIYNNIDLILTKAFKLVGLLIM